MVVGRFASRRLICHVHVSVNIQPWWFGVTFRRTIRVTHREGIRATGYD